MATRKYIADFETTVYEGQTDTEVWASALTEIGNTDPDKVKVWNTIDGLFDYLFKLKSNSVVYFHNLAFDGSFILNWLLRQDRFKQAFDFIDDKTVVPIDRKYMENNTYRYTISDMGQWYNIFIRVNDHTIDIKDSLKLLPFSVASIGKSFNTLHKKLSMEYIGYRMAGGYIDDNEMEYIKNDVLVVGEALDTMFSEGHKKSTIGSCCLTDYRSMITKYAFDEFFPNLKEIDIPSELKTPYIQCADDFIRKSYKGGWCYVVKGKENIEYNNGVTADVNSLYPSVMHSISGNKYPIGTPTFWHGNYIPVANTIDNIPIDQDPDTYFFIKIRTEFKIKEGYLPCIQIKDNLLYRGNEWLETSDIKINGEYHNKYIDLDGNLKSTQVELTLTCTDWKLINEHYDLYNTEIIGGCYYYAEAGIFDCYIDKWRKVKETSTGAMRTLAKLFLNNLYGKLASNDNSNFKVAHLEDGVLKFVPYEAHEKQVISIACGSAITSYARDFTIRTAQKNYYGNDKRGFIYADTDSIHCDLKPDELIGVDVHPTKFLHWKLEGSWDRAIFVRQKAYIEHIIAENLEPIEEPYNKITCAGMGKRCKQLLDLSMRGIKEVEGMTEEEEEFLKTKRDFCDFKVGLKIPSKLVAKNIKGGVLLVPTTYEMH